MSDNDSNADAAAENDEYDATIKDRYVTPPHPTAYGGLNRVSSHFYIGQPRASRLLSEINSYTLHREYKRAKPLNPYYIYARRQQLQVDLIDMRRLSRFNRGTAYLLVAIDCFSKKVWVQRLKTRNAVEVAAAMVDILDAMQEPPVSIFCDRGTELANRVMRALLHRRGIRLMHPNSEVKAGIVERVNRSLQNMIYRHMTENETRRYIDTLPDIIQTYNRRPHRSIDHLTPEEAELPANRDRAVTALRKHYASAITPNYKTRFSVGDTVRVKTAYGNRFARGYEEQFSRETYTVVRINRRMAIPMYILQSDEDGVVIPGGFYQNEMQAFVRQDIFKVEHVLRRRVRNGQQEIFVKWLNFGPQHNSWIPESNITKVYNNRPDHDNDDDEGH
jgi:transposase InsO family protein